MTWTFRDCELDASTMRSLAGVPESALLTAKAIARAAGITLTRRAVSGCVAHVDLSAWRVFLHCHGYPWTQNFGCAHELGHIIQALNGAPFPHDEDRVDWGATALLMPRAAVLKTLQHTGLDDPRALVREFPLVPPVRVLLRVAWVQRRAAAVFVRGERLVWAAEGRSVPERGTLWEQRLVREVRKTGLIAKDINGAVAVPVGETGVEGVLVVYPDGGTVGW